MNTPTPLGYQSRPQPPPQQNRPENHVLNIRQEPESARVIVRGKEKDRKPIDPPPVVQMRVLDEFNVTCSYLHNPYYFCVVTLWEAEEDLAFRVEDPLGPPPLTGQLVSSLHRLKDYDNTGTFSEEQGFFVFGDLSAGVMGRYRLNFAVYEYKPRQGNVHFIKSINSRIFEVSSPKDWEGVKESTALSRSFADQGVRLRLRKESRNSNKRPFPQPPVPSMPQTPLRPLPSHSDSYGSISSHEGEAALKRYRTFEANQMQGYMPATSQGWQPGAFAPAGSQHGSYGPMPGYESQYSGQPGQYSGVGQNSYASYPSVGASHRPGEPGSFMSPYSGSGSQMQPQSAQYRSLPPTQQQPPRSSTSYQQSTPSYITPSTGSVYAGQGVYGGYSGQSSAYGSQSQSYSHSGYTIPPHPSPRNDELPRPMANPSNTPHLNPIHKFESQVPERPASSRPDPHQHQQHSPYEQGQQHQGGGY